MDSGILFTVLVYIILGIAVFCAWLLCGPTAWAVVVIILVGHILRDCVHGIGREGNELRCRPWPAWSDYVAVVLAILLVCSAWQCRERSTGASVFLLVLGLIYGAAHARQIVVRDGHYYGWVTPNALV